MAKQVYIFLADGFEEIEGLTVVDVLRRGGVEITTVSVSGKREVTGSHGIQVMADALFASEMPDADMYVLPGGMPGTLHLGGHEELLRMLQKASDAGKWVCAICAAPSVLGKIGLLNGKEATCYPGFEEQLTGAVVSDKPVVACENIITGKGMGKAIPFALELLAVLKTRKDAEKVASSIIF